MCAVQLVVFGLMFTAAAHISSVSKIRGASPLSVLKLRKLRADLDTGPDAYGHALVADSRNEAMARELCQFNQTFTRLPVKAKHYARALLRRVEGFGSCALVGPSAALLGRGLGAEIDGHDLVIRVDEAGGGGNGEGGGRSLRAADVGSRTGFAVAGAHALGRRLMRACDAERVGAAAAGGASRAAADGVDDAREGACPPYPLFASPDGPEGRALAQRCHTADGTGVYPLPRVVLEMSLAALTPHSSAPRPASLALLLGMLLCPHGALRARRSSAQLREARAHDRARRAQESAEPQPPTWPSACTAYRRTLLRRARHYIASRRAARAGRERARLTLASLFARAARHAYALLARSSSLFGQASTCTGCRRATQRAAARPRLRRAQASRRARTRPSQTSAMPCASSARAGARPRAAVRLPASPARARAPRLASSQHGPPRSSTRTGMRHTRRAHGRPHCPCARVQPWGAWHP
jgi:hypothetical protein